MLFLLTNFYLLHHKYINKSDQLLFTNIYTRVINFFLPLVSILSSYILAETSYFFDEMMMMPVLSIAPKHLNYLVFQYFDIEFT